MSDDEEDRLTTGTNSAHEDNDDANDEERKHGSSSDDDSSSSSSGSSSSDSDSDSDSDNDGDGKQDGDKNKASRGEDRKYSIESLTGSSTGSGFARAGSGGAEMANAQPLNVNSTRAVARFREQASTEPGLMALGTKKRDRRTIEEIQRDIQKKRATSSLVSSSSSVKKPLGSSSAPLARASPPKSSPVMSPESGTEVDRMNIGLGGGKAALKPKITNNSNSARSRLEKKLLGRGGGAATTARAAAPAKKPAGSASAQSSSAGAGLVITNISAASKTLKMSGGGTSVGSGSDHEMSSSDFKGMEPKIEPRVVDNSKPDGRVVRSVLRSMLRFGDLTDVNLFPDDHHKSFADEYKLPGFIARSNLESLCKMSEEKLLKLACEIADSVRRVLEDKKDVLKFGEVEMKPSQIIERLYENLKLRVAVQRALYDAGASTSKGVSAVYSLVSKNPDCSVVGIGRDFPAWSWAEKEHDWNGRKDAALLFGIYIHGFGAWEDILNDDRLMMQQQRALKGERLKKRAENLLKRVPPPLSGPAGEPQLVQIASNMLNGNQNPSQGLGAQISAIVNGASVKGGRMQRAAERMAARRSDSGARDAVADDSIRKSNTQGTDRSRDRSRDRDRDRDRDRSRDRERSRERERDRERDRSRDRGDRERERDRDRDRERGRDQDRSRDRETAIRKPSISSPAFTTTSNSSRSNGAPEAGEVGVASSSASSLRRESTTTKSSSSSKRSASDDVSKSSHSGEERGQSPRKKSKHHEEKPSSSLSSSSSRSHKPTSSSSEVKPVKAKRRLSQKEYMEKWEPNKKLKEIRQVLKKMNIMANWSKGQDDEVVVEKMYKYVTTIGEEIDKLVLGAGDQSDPDWDELCTALWTHAASHTPFEPAKFEQLYDDICADSDRLRDLEKIRPAASASSS